MFFVDEIHRLPRAVEETFYPAMEDRQLPITVGAGAGARVVTLDLPPFTLIGATTRAGLLTTPLRDRFGIQHRLDHYDADDLAAHRRPLGARARRRRSTPAARGRSPSAPAAPRASPTGCCERVRDFARGPRRRGDRRRRWPARRSTCSRSTTPASTGSTARSCPTICERFSGGPVGLSTLAVAVQEEPDTIEDVYEPYLLQRGFLKRTPRGPLRDRRTRSATSGSSRRAEDSTLF